jgi:hypothetical protein
MSLLNEPTNKNFLSPLGFVFNLKKTPATNFFVTRASLPGLNLAFAEIPTPFVKMPVPGEKIQFNDLSITFKVDEDMRNWNEIFEWMVALGFPKSFDQYKEIRQKQLGEGIYSDATLLILNSSMNPNMEFQFVNLFPYMLSDLDFSTQGADVEYIEATVQFRYEYFTARKL